MKKIVLVLMAAGFLFELFAQGTGTVKTRPESHGWYRVFNGTVGAGGDGADTTSAWAQWFYDGAQTWFFETDTTGASVKSANQSDSCLTVHFQIKRRIFSSGSYEQDWGGFYSESDLSKTRVDSVARGLVNASANFYMVPALKDGWAWGDSVRAILSIGVGDSLTVKMDVGGL